MDPRHGALFFSVAPGRLLTLIEPRLVGDPFAEEDAAYWGAATFDAGNPYFLDLALGCIPLALAAAAAATRTGRASLALAALGALFATGRYFPPAGALLGALPVFRYPEKWWLLTTFALAAAAAVGWDACRSDPVARGRAIRSAFALASAALLLAALSRLFPRALSALLEAFALSGGTVAPELLAALTGPLLASAAGLALLALLARSERVPPRLLAFLCAAFFLLDATRRVVGSLPAGGRATHGSPTRSRPCSPRHGQALPTTARRIRRSCGRGSWSSGLRPALSGNRRHLRRALRGRDDVDRMARPTPRAFAVELARLPWGDEKARRLERAGVTLVDARPRPDPPGTEGWAGSGGSARAARRGSQAVSRRGTGPIAVVERRSHRLVVDVDGGADARGTSLAVLRTYDPHWTARAGGRSLEVRKSAGGVLEVAVPAGRARVEITYENPWFLRGLALSFAGLLAALVIARQTRLSHHPRA
jgi:hypothetical protein